MIVFVTVLNLMRTHFYCLSMIFLLYRLWGEHGQTHLETAQVCLINATALGAEIMKGLVLPGIGGFMIVDDSMVTEADLDSK